MKTKSSPPPDAPPAAPEAAPTPPAPPVELPVVTSFGMLKKGSRWVGVALETQGSRVLRTAIVEADPSRDHVRVRLDRAQFCFETYNESPFGPEEETIP